MERQRVIRFELKQLLERKRMTQEEFGSKCTPPLNRHQVSKLTRTNSISLEMLERVIDALELDSEEVGSLIKVYKK